MITATYSPDDNKIRLYSLSRLDAETYARVRAAGFIYAPKQELFVAPAWSPEREDLARALDEYGEIRDDDSSLTDRAEERAERFEDYEQKRRLDANRAHAAVSAIADGIPLGQPILVGHHSEKHARKDAERIENGMRRAIKAFETAEYWKDRAKGAIRHAKYKERPDVRARRIKGLEADQRKHERTKKDAETFSRLWSRLFDAKNPPMKRKDGRTGTALEIAIALANYDHISRCYTLAEFPRTAPLASKYEGSLSLWDALGGNTAGDPPEQHAIVSPEWAQAYAIKVHAGTVAYAERWLSHIANRLEYERAMLADCGGLAADKFDFQPGGTVKTRRDRSLIILRVNKKNGVSVSLTVAGQSWTVGIEEVTDYTPPTAERASAVEKATKLAPLVNYPGEGFETATREEWDRMWKDMKGTKKIPAGEKFEAHRQRQWLKGHKLAFVFLTDEPVKWPQLTEAAKNGTVIEEQAGA